MKLLKKWLLLVSTLLIVLSCVVIFKTSANATGNGIGTATIIADSLNVRSGPGKDNEPLGKLEKNNNAVVLEEVETEEGYWFKIEFNGSEGYISAEFADYEPFEVEEVVEEEEVSEEEEALDEVNDIKDEKGGNYKLTFGLIAAIVILLGIILITVKSLKDGDFGGRYDDDEDYDDEDYDDEDYDDEDDYDEEEDEEEEEDDEYEYVMVRRPKQAAQQQYRQPAPQQQYRQPAPQQQYRQPAPQQQYRQPAPQQQYRQPAPQQQYRQPAPQQQYRQPVQQPSQQPKPAKRLDDYTIDIDPSFFDD